MKTIKLFITLFVITSPLFSQQIGIWKNYSNMKSIVDARVTEKGIWTATTGGAFFYNFEDGSFLQLTKDKGLSNNSLTSMEIDNYGNIWFGSQNGIIDVYNPDEGVFVKRILEIFSSDKTKKRINDLAISGDTVYASTDFGLSLIDVKTYFFFDTFLKFGQFASDTRINNSYSEKLLFVATESGVAKQREGTVNLSAPESWENYSTNNGLPSNSVYQIINYQNQLIASTSKGLAVFNGTNWDPFLTEFKDKSITDLIVKNNSLYIIAENLIWQYENGSLNQLYGNLSYPLNKIIPSDNQLYFGSTAGIINPENVQSAIAPDGPASNFFPGITVDRNSNLWAGSGSNTAAVGFYKYDGDTWTNYSMSNVPGLNSNLIFKTYVAPDNTIYFMTWGEGFIRLKDGKFDFFNAQNTDMVGISTNINLVVISGLSVDTKGNLWILSYATDNKKPLSVLRADSTWEFFTNGIRNAVINTYDLIVDENDTKWMIIGDDEATAGEAIYYFNEVPLYTNETTGWGSISSENGLNSSVVNAIALDRRGELWIGTGAGINIISSTTRPKSSISNAFALRSQVINAIAVDALNQKWIGTNQGIYLLSSDGTKILANYNENNSPLISDFVKSLAFDNNTGTLYIGSDYGLTSLTTTAINPQESFSDLFVFPNPVYIQDESAVNITIDGLIRDTDIKILSIAGKLVNAFSSPGGRIASWDGKDLEGKYVNSGVYLIVAYDKEGNSVMTGKVAIVRK